MLDPEDAKFVDIIHTCIEIYGYGGRLGHADFYPNGDITYLFVQSHSN